MRVTRIPGQIAESVLSIAGVRVGIEEPHYVVTSVSDRVEVRRYGPRIAAETTVAADEDRARNIGFRRLARYIFGGNQRDEEIAMTAPVAQRSGTIRFFMPSKWTMDTLPPPNDVDVSLIEVPGETVAVLRFSGDRSPSAVAAKTDELEATLRDKNFEIVGEPVAWFYDPPWTLPFRRRSEIAIPVRA